jgi:hypothetical protein
MVPVVKGQTADTLVATPGQIEVSAVALLYLVAVGIQDGGYPVQEPLADAVF